MVVTPLLSGRTGGRWAFVALAGLLVLAVLAPPRVRAAPARTPADEGQVASDAAPVPRTTATKIVARAAAKQRMTKE